MPRAAKPGRFDRYLEETQGPWLSLVFVLPLAVLYETANRGLLGPVQAGPGEQLVAFSLLRRAFDAANATGAMLPALTLVACLLGWHIAQRRTWAIRPHYLAAMTVEATLLALPALAAAVLLARGLPWSAATLEIPVTRLATLAIGAAVYEELIFRLLGFTLIHGLCVDVLGLNRRAGAITTVFTTAALFAAYHYLGCESFQWPSFVFRTAAGVFLGALFALRGFGITVGCHAAYDLLWVMLVSKHLAI
jgi:hypothetical protein